MYPDRRRLCTSVCKQKKKKAADRGGGNNRYKASCLFPLFSLVQGLGHRGKYFWRSVRCCLKRLYCMHCPWKGIRARSNAMNEDKQMGVRWCRGEGGGYKKMES